MSFEEERRRSADLRDQVGAVRETMRDPAESSRSVNYWIIAVRDNAARVHTAARSGDLQGEMSYWVAIAANALTRAEVLQVMIEGEASSAKA
jgi:hypothetical protein